MTPKEAADRLRPHFHLESMPAEDLHHVKFVEGVAAELGVEPTVFNLHQVAGALDDAGLEGDSRQFPMMLYSRTHHAVEGVAPSIYLPRHDAVSVHVDNDEQIGKLGAGWVENLDELPPRGDIPLNAPVPEPTHAPEQPHRNEHGGTILPSGLES